jgi:hypothetical protein
MIILLVRIVMVIGLIAGVYIVIRRLLEPSEFIRCSRCESKGFWFAASGKEICDWSKGSGKLPRNLN